MCKVKMSDKVKQSDNFIKRKNICENVKILKPTVNRTGLYKVIKRFKETGSYSQGAKSTPYRPVRIQYFGECQVTTPLWSQSREKIEEGITAIASYAGLHTDTCFIDGSETFHCPRRP